jgi:hypothetical protein
MTNRPTSNWDKFSLPDNPKQRQHILSYLTDHLVQIGRWSHMEWMLTDIVLRGGEYSQPWAEVRYHLDGSYTIYEQQLELLWRHADVQQQWPVALRCALISASIHGRSQHIKPSLLAGLVTVGTPQGG